MKINLNFIPMKKILFLLGAFALLHTTHAQDLPKLSQPAKAEFTVGVTKIALQYSRPSVRGRVIFGDLVPYNEVWRLGANEPTKITVSQQLIFVSSDGAVHKLDTGKYAIFAFPSADGDWKIVFNTDHEQWGAGSYDEAKNVVTLYVKTMECPFTETLLIDINNISVNGASIIIQWDKTRVEIPFTVDTDAHAQANIDAAIASGKDLDKVYAAAANYFFNMKSDFDKAIEYIDQSIAVKTTFSNLFLKARILEKKGDKKEAMKLAEEALKLAQEAKHEQWISYIEETIETWKKN